MMYTVCNRHPLVEMCMLFVGTSIIHHSTEGIFILCNIWDLLIYSYKLIKKGGSYALSKKSNFQIRQRTL